MACFASACVACCALLGCELTCRTSQAAGADSCATPTLSVLVPSEPKWSFAAVRLTRHLHELTDLDRCAQVTVRPDPSGVTLRVTTSDGRAAERHVESIDELLAAAEAVLVLPPPVASAAARVAALDVPPTEPKPAPTEPTTAHVELGAGGALRVGGTPAYVGAGLSVFAGFVLDRWLLTMTARLDVSDGVLSQPTPSDFEMQSTAVSVSAGRRLNLGQASIDASLAANVVLESQDADEAEREIHGAAEDFRLGGAVRISGPRSASIRAFAAGDFEASPSRLRSKHYIDHALPILPWWSSGLAVGVLWGAR